MWHQLVHYFVPDGVGSFIAVLGMEHCLAEMFFLSKTINKKISTRIPLEELTIRQCPEQLKLSIVSIPFSIYIVITNRSITFWK